MLKNKTLIKNRNLFWVVFAVFAIIYVAAMIPLTIYDYGVTSYFYKRGSAFGVIFEILGPCFMPFLGIYSIVSLLFIVKPKKLAAALFYFALTLLYAYYVFMGAFTFKHSYAPFMFVPSLILYALFTAACFFINKKMGENKREIHKKIVSVIFFTVLASMLGLDVIKIIFGRKRFITINGESEFLPWYIIQSHQLNSSFPSGHVSRAALVICFSLLPYYSKKQGKVSVLLTVIALAFTVSVAFSRLTEGMHYPTDILTGAALTFSAFYLSKHFFFANKKSEKTT